MKYKRVGEALMRMLYCWSRQLLWCEFIRNKVNTDPGYCCKRVRSWANKQPRASRNRPVNSKAGIYVCSELWRPQGQNIYMKSAQQAGLCIYMRGKGVFTLTRVCLCICVIGSNSTVRCQKRKWSASLVISGIYHCGNEHQRKCWGTLETHQGYQKSNNTQRWC